METKNILTMPEVTNKCKVRIVNETGIGYDTKVFIDDKLMQNVLSVEIGKQDSNTDFVTAKIEFLGVKIDMMAKKDENSTSD